MNQSLTLMDVSLSTLNSLCYRNSNSGLVEEVIEMEYACFHGYPFVNHLFHHSVYPSAMALMNHDLCSYLYCLRFRSDSRNLVYVVDYEASLLVAISLDDSRTKPKAFVSQAAVRLTIEDLQTCILASGNPILDANRSRANTSG